jgi:hypothetical protein
LDAHEVLHVVPFVVRSAQHVVPLGQAAWGHEPASSLPPPLELPLLLPLEPPLLLPLELPLLPPLEPPLLLPLELPLLPPLEPPLLPPLELPLPDEVPPPSSPPVMGAGEELPHAIHTNALAITAAAPTVAETDAREAM